MASANSPASTSSPPNNTSRLSAKCRKNVARLQTGATRDLHDGRFLVPVLHEQVQRGGLQALPCVRCPSAHGHSLSEATGSHHSPDDATIGVPRSV